MQNNLDLLPSDLLIHLDAVLPRFTQLAIHGEYPHGVLLVSAGGVIMLCCLLYGAVTLRVTPLAVFVSFAGLLLAALGWPSVVAPEAVLARELLIGK